MCMGQAGKETGSSDPKGMDGDVVENQPAAVCIAALELCGAAHSHCPTPAPASGSPSLSRLY
jgi:hypothetical protein